MALHEIMILALLLAAFAFGMGWVSKPDTYMKGYRSGSEDVSRITAEYIHSSSGDGHTEYKRGWEDSKQVYYTDMIADRIAEADRQKREQEAAYKAMNSETMENFCPISSDLLMAYGVSTVGQLPKSIREAYQVNDNQNGIDLDSLLRIEKEG